MRYIIAFLALAGVVVASLALRVHYSTGTEPCSINEHWDCGIVNHSSYATVKGIFWHIAANRHPDSTSGRAPRDGFPVAAVGVIGYALILLVALLRLRWLNLLLALGGFACALYLSNIEAHVLEVWCLYCVISQGIIALIALLSVAWVAVHATNKRRVRP